jgi:hypothetical protein
MACFFPAINNFSQKLEIRGKDVHQNMPQKAAISCYSLTSMQKGVGITLFVLGTITLVVGILSLGAINTIGTKGAWAMIGIGSGVAVGTFGFMSINHLLLLKRVNKYLTELLWVWHFSDTMPIPFPNPDCYNWKQADSYPDDGVVMDATDMAKSRFSTDGGIYVKRYIKNNCGIIEFKIEFNRTSAIQKERK